jgi:flagellar assembly protein FliH
MAGIIKAAGEIDRSVSQATRAFQFDDVGRSYLDRVRAEASRILAEAHREAARIKAAATIEGRQAAIQAAQASLRGRLDQQLSSVLAALDKAAKGIEQSRHAWERNWEKHVIQLAAAIAKRLCRRELTRQPEITLEWVREALELAAGNAEIILRLHPDDVGTLESHLDTITKRLATLAPVRIVSDTTISEGGCRVDTEFGSLDQQLEAQIERITEELLA